MTAIIPNLQNPEKDRVLPPRQGVLSESKELDEKSVNEFSEMFLTSFLKNMMPETEDGFFGTGNANDMYKSFWIEAVAHQMSENDSFGIAEQVLNGIKKSTTYYGSYAGQMIPINTQGAIYDITS